nr:MAG TPA: hypothetical protein [Caudoviricetes sp.]DAT87365.1 MAG TPA: hypothetical protein [Caudoviricetes sp.]
MQIMDSIQLHTWAMSCRNLIFHEWRAKPVTSWIF